MVAAIDSKSIAVWRAGSIPAGGTKVWDNVLNG